MESPKPKTNLDMILKGIRKGKRPDVLPRLPKETHAELPKEIAIKGLRTKKKPK